MMLVSLEGDAIQLLFLEPAGIDDESITRPAARPGARGGDELLEGTYLKAGRRKPDRAGKPPMPNKSGSLPVADLDALVAGKQGLNQATRHVLCGENVLRPEGGDLHSRGWRDAQRLIEFRLRRAQACDGGQHGWRELASSRRQCRNLAPEGAGIRGRGLSVFQQ